MPDHCHAVWKHQGREQVNEIPLPDFTGRPVGILGSGNVKKRLVPSTGMPDHRYATI